jgi:hypothetical protein
MNVVLLQLCSELELSFLQVNLWLLVREVVNDKVGLDQAEERAP